MSIIKKYTETSLVLRIVIGLILGLILALIFPKQEWIGIFGTLFVGALKAVAPVLVFVLISSSLAQSRQKMGKEFLTIIFLYFISTYLAACVAVLASYMFPVTLTQFATSADATSAPQSLGDVFTTLLSNLIANPIDSIANGNYLGILFWSLHRKHRTKTFWTSPMHDEMQYQTPVTRTGSQGNFHWRSNRSGWRSDCSAA